LDSAQLQSWMKKRAKQDDQLYERFGRPLESTHQGEFVAISDDGRTIVGSNELAVASQAIQQFGRGSFALRRIGAPAEAHWRRILE
jgi:hypothetical protein